MAKLTGMDAVNRSIDRAVKKSFGGRVKKFIMADLKHRLHSQEQPDGSKFPQKAQSTIKAYRSRGFNTKEFLIATGESSRLKADVDEYGGIIQLRITPVGHEILSYNVPSRVLWFPDYTKGAAFDVIKNIIQEDISHDLSR